MNTQYKNPIEDPNYNGCLENPEDSRDIVFGDIPEVFKADPNAPSWEQGYEVPEAKNIKREHQGSSYSCVGQGWSKYLEVLEAIESKKVSDLSAKFVYRQIFQGNGGAYIRDGAKIAVDQGDCEEKLFLSYENGQNPSEQFMRQGEITQAMKDNALIFKSKKYVNQPVSNKLTSEDWENMRQIIWQYGGFVAGYSGHCQYFYGYGLTPEGKKFVKTVGSYGEGSDAVYSEFTVNLGAKIFDITSLVDLPNPPPKINRPKYIEKVVKKKDNADCYVVFLALPLQQQIHKIVGDKVFKMLGLNWEEVVEVSDQEFNSYALGGEITEDRIDHFREFLNLSNSEWTLRFSPNFTSKALAVFQVAYERITDLFGSRFGGMQFIGKYRGQCVTYARSLYPSLPSGLWNYASKKRIINSFTPRIGCVAIHNIGLYGHVSIVMEYSGTGTEPTDIFKIREANFRKGFITEREAMKAELAITGFYI
jgi:hypothetical protein